MGAASTSGDPAVLTCESFRVTYSNHSRKDVLVSDVVKKKSKDVKILTDMLGKRTLGPVSFKRGE